ncbi:hypothetical protein PROFUN_11913, partial [Planoprotostelium fungivorum]
MDIDSIIQRGQEDDDLALPSSTLDILRGFLRDKEDREKEEQRLVQEGANNTDITESFSEDWQLSQFWYTDDTSDRVAREALKMANGGRIACLSTPSIFRALKRISPALDNCFLFEYDKRFSFYKEKFVFYDYIEPTNLPQELKGSFDFIIVDPPFLSEECQVKASETVQFLRRSQESLTLVLT